MDHKCPLLVKEISSDKHKHTIVCMFVLPYLDSHVFLNPLTIKIFFLEGSVVFKISFRSIIVDGFTFGKFASLTSANKV